MTNGVIPKRMSVRLTIGFHPEQVNCDGCRCLIDDPGCRGRKRCFLTGEIIHYPKQRGVRCPLEEESENGIA